VSKRAADLLERMNRVGGTPAAAAAPPVLAQPSPPQGERSGGRSGGGRRRHAAGGDRATRITIDLEPDLYRALRIFVLDHRLDASEIVRGLIALLDDPVVTERLLRKLDEGSGNVP